MDSYEKKYFDAFERLKQWDKEHQNGYVVSDRDKFIFPELADSEDEKNIKGLINELKCSLRAANCQNEACNGGHEKRIALLEWAIAWLEKQKSVDWNDKDEKIRNRIIATIHLYYGEPLEDEAKEMVNWLEKHGEKKPV